MHFIQSTMMVNSLLVLGWIVNGIFPTVSMITRTIMNSQLLWRTTRPVYQWKTYSLFTYPRLFVIITNHIYFVLLVPFFFCMQCQNYKSGSWDGPLLKDSWSRTYSRTSLRCILISNFQATVDKIPCCDDSPN